MTHPIGDGHEIVWFDDGDGAFGLMDFHDGCATWVAWRGPAAAPDFTTGHSLISGGRGAEADTTIHPEIHCAGCGARGHITAGTWVSA